jgi:SAM-dependent methyltransferase
MTEQGIVVGNLYDKYNSRNPIVGWIMRGFHDALQGLVRTAGPGDIHEIGCGEGYWVLQWQRDGLHARGSDFSGAVIQLARANAGSEALPQDMFDVCSVYELEPDRDSADLVVCCEVLEHLEHPDLALQKLHSVTGRYLIVSVPREPLWSVLNMARGRYWSDLGNTPGHIQRWSRKSFIDLVSQYFVIDKALSPLPWTMLLCRPRAGEEIVERLRP